MNAQNPVRVLIVEDNSDLAYIVKEMLAFEGCSCVTACDAIEALALLPSFKPECVLMDLGLPGVDGYKTAKAIRSFADFEHIPIIAHTAWDDPKTCAKLRAYNFTAHIVKPAGPSQIMKTIREALAAR